MRVGEGGRGQDGGRTEGGDLVVFAVEVARHEGKAGKGARDAVEVGGGVRRPDLVEGDGEGGELAAGQGRDVEIADCYGDREVGVVGRPDEAAGVLEIA